MPPKSFLIAAVLSCQFLSAAVESAPVQVGDSVPDVVLASIDGEPHTLSGALADGPVVLVLYRGVW